jgi:hypothetical protein
MIRYLSKTMRHQNSDIAILLFSRSAERECLAKRWTKDHGKDYLIARCLIDRTKRQLSTAPFEVIHLDETRQKGSNFGEKLTHAFRSVFHMGFQYVVAVGNDSIEPKVDWLKVATSLRDGEAVLGPDERGGVYLLGLSADYDYEKLFKQIDWNTNQVFNQLLLYCNEAAILRQKKDLNTLEDLWSDHFLSFLIGGHTIQPNIFGKSQLKNKPVVVCSNTLRAPPVFA